MSEFDVFLSYNSADRPAVVDVAERLRSAGLRPWLDVWHMVPGTAWQNGLADAVAACPCASVMIGASGPGSWQSAEAMLILNRAFTDRSYRLIPVLLPGAPADAESPFSRFIPLFSWVDFRAGLADSDALHRLISGIQSRSPGPPVQPPARQAPTPTGLEWCLETLGVPERDLPTAIEWLAQTVADGRRYPAPPDADWPAAVRQAVTGFKRDLELFALPERLLESSSYLSIAKLGRMYRAHQQELGREDDPANRFRLLHRYLAEQQRLVFGPALLLAGRQLPSGDDTWVYFTGEFRLVIPPGELDAIPDARRIIGTRDERNLMSLVSRVFEAADPFFMKILEFDGSIGPHRVTMDVSRKYLTVESHNARTLGSALLGDPIYFAGFGTLAGNALQPVICRITG
jgi:hypothetical protein